MMHVVLAGNYPAHTYEKLRALLPETEFDLTAVDTPEAYEAMTDAEIMILRIFIAGSASRSCIPSFPGAAALAAVLQPQTQIYKR